MNPTEELRNAVTRVTGTLPTPSGIWQLQTPHGRLSLTVSSNNDLRLCFVELRNPEEWQALGVNPATQEWHIPRSAVLPDTPAIVAELVRKLARCGYEPPAPILSGDPAEETAPPMPPPKASMVFFSGDRDALKMIPEGPRYFVETPGADPVAVLAASLLNDPVEGEKGLAADDERVDLYKAYADSHGLTRTEGKFELLAIIYNDRAATPLHRYSIGQVETGDGSGDWNIEQRIEKDPQGEWVKYADLQPAAGLAEALRNLLARYVGLVESGDAGSWDAEAESEVIAARKALQA